MADDIVHDALVDPRVLKLARSGAELIAAGKRGGRPSPHQRDINEVLIERARAGRRVLRLKGGDPVRVRPRLGRGLGADRGRRAAFASFPA